MHRRLSSFVFCIILFALAGSHAASAQVEIRYAVTPGVTYRFEQITDTTMNMTINANGQNVQVSESTHHEMRGRVVVLEVKDGRPRVTKITFDKDAATVFTNSMAPQPRRTPFALAGQTIIVTEGDEGAITVKPDGDPNAAAPSLEPDILEQVRSLAMSDPAFPPGKPLAIGEAWTTQLGHANDTVRPTYTFTLLGVEDRAAKLKAHASYEMRAQGMTISGTLDGESTVDLGTGLPVAGTVQGPMDMEGTTDAGGGMLATINGKGSYKQTMKVTFVDPDAPEDGAARATPPNAPAAVETHKDWTRYVHVPSGVALLHPPTWTVQEAQGVLVLTPDDYDQNNELLFGFGASADGETDAASPKAQQNLDALIQSQAPTFRRQAAPQPIRTPSGSGAKYVYSGTLPDGRTAQCTVFVRIIEDNAVALAVLADAQRTNMRTPMLREIYDTIAMHTPEPQQGGGEVGDRRLLGMFQGEVLNSSVEGMYINTQLVYAFGADSRVYFGAKSMMSAHKRDYNDDLIWTTHGETAEDVSGGNWSATNGYLTINWDDGTRSVFAYGFEPDGSLVLRNPTTKELINFYPRIR
jgi:hypothetical protein